MKRKKENQGMRDQYQEAMKMFLDDPRSYGVIRSHYMIRYGNDKFLKKIEKGLATTRWLQKKI